MPQKNKRRMYIAYFRRASTPSLPARYHTCLFVTPKNPDPMSTNKQCWIYHVVDRVAQADDAAKGYWIFEARPTFARTQKLAGVLLLGKIPPSLSDEDIKSILESVPRQNTVAEDPSWRCRHWIWAALGVSLGFE